MRVRRVDFYSKLNSALFFLFLCKDVWSENFLQLYKWRRIEEKGKKRKIELSIANDVTAKPFDVFLFGLLDYNLIVQGFKERKCTNVTYNFNLFYTQKFRPVFLNRCAAAHLCIVSTKCAANFFWLLFLWKLGNVASF